MYESEDPISIPASVRRPLNWPLLIGCALVALILFLALFGPGLAPKDPRDHALIIQVDGRWLTPPYPAFTPGYPLGSDNLGRDLYSWLLWSVGPTMTLVTIVATLRMIFGLSVGAAAGWSDRWTARAFDGLIAAALAVPALIAALIVITAIGFRLGVWAFVVGLAVTGWAETAQLVREQTRTIKAQEAVEAARALGASGMQIFILHIVPQVMPMIWMLLAFEIANTLVTTAGLGFLGYYLGGAIFTEVDDFVYQRISEMPELGQMLATVWLVLDEPWAMVAAGTVVFLIVLAFSLLGEGLQSRLTRKLGGARRFYLHLAGDVAPWIDERMVVPVGKLLRNSWGKAAVAICLVVLIGSTVLRVQSRRPPSGSVPESTAAAAAPLPATSGSSATPEPEPPPVSPLEVPGGHMWANQWGDPWATRWMALTGPTTTTVQWSFEIDGSFTGGPAVDAQGLLYVAARPADEAPGWLYVLDPAGNLVWETRLEDLPVGTPALGPEGAVYVADKSGITAISAEGRLLWRFTPEDAKPTTAGPIVGPEGAIYYKSQSGLISLTAEGELRWHAPIPETLRVLAPKLSPDGETVFWGGFAFRYADGEPLVQDEPSAVPTQFIVGADGRPYAQHDVQLVVAAVVGAEGSPGAKKIVGGARVFDWRAYTWQGADAGVTPSGLPWLLARPATGGMGLGFYWGRRDGELASKLSIPGANSINVIGVDQENIAYICMDVYASASSCVAFGPDSDRTLWRVEFRGTQALAGAALAPGRLFVATWGGKLMALGDAEIVESQGIWIGEPETVQEEDAVASLFIIP
jgi:peptide/nickel transport system permease protein